MDALQPGDALLIAGKGHETGQVVGRGHPALRRHRAGERGGRGARRAGRVTRARSGPRDAAVAATGGGEPAGLGGQRRLDRHPQPRAGRSLRGAERGAGRPRLRRRGAGAGRGGGAGVARRRRVGPRRAASASCRTCWTGLRALGAAARARFGGRLVAVTGSVGKTGTKEMLRTALRGAGPVHAAEKSFNNHWGVPLTLARMPADATSRWSRSA